MRRLAAICILVALLFSACVRQEQKQSAERVAAGIAEVYPH